MKLILILFILLISIITNANEEVYNQISKAAPHLTEDYRLQLSIEIRRACVKNKINCEIFTAILAQESMFKTSAVNTRTKDYGIGQINKRTIAAYGFCEQKMVTDRQYSINAAAEVFSYFQRRYGAREAKYFCRYNVGTKSLQGNLGTACDNYVQKVKRYMK